MTEKTEREELVKRLIEMRGRLARGVFEYRLGDQFDGDFQNIDDAISALTAQSPEPVAWMNPHNGVVIDARQKKQIGLGYGYPNFSIPLAPITRAATKGEGNG